MPKIIVSYRRTDSAGIAGRIFDRLVLNYGHGSVYMDIDNIPFGADFRRHINAALNASDAMVVVVGPKWIGQGPRGRTRINEEDDPVRIELETALELKIPVLPVLVDGAVMPKASQLPDSLKDFAFLNAAEVDTGRDFHPHVDRLIRGIDRVLTAAATDADPFAVISAQAGLGLTASPQNAGRDDGPRASLPATGSRMRKRLTSVAAVAVLLAATGGVALNYERLSSLALRLLDASGLRSSSDSRACADIKAILPLTRANFASIRGEQTSKTRWSTSKRISGYATCYVQRLMFHSFACETDRMPIGDARKVRKSKAEALRTCLGADWSALPGTADSQAFGNLSTSQIVSTAVFAAANEGAVTLSIYQTKGTQPETPAKAPPTVTKFPENYCAELKRVANEGKSQFASILGRERGTNFWAARIQLPGWNDCYISEIDTFNNRKLRYYTCGIAPFRNLDETNAAVEKVGASVKACMGNDWFQSRRKNSDGRITLEFERSSDIPTIEIRGSKTDAAGWQVKLDVNAPSR